MVKWFHVVSVGTSSIRNFVRANGSEPGSVDELVNFIAGDPRKASAELNAFLGFVKESMHAPPNEVGVHLICSDTDECVLAGEAIGKFLKLKGYAVTPDSPKRVASLGVSEAVFDDGLANLIDEYFDAVERERKGGGEVRVYLNLTGGFKAEASVLLLAAAVSGAAAAYYIHESFKEVVTVPLPPLSINKGLEDLVREYLSKRDVWDCELFEERSMSHGPYYHRKLQEYGLFLPNNDCRPRKWLTRIVERGRP